MLKNKISTALALLLLTVPSLAQDNQQKPSQEELIQQEVERLERGLKLEYWQVFYVDSTLRHNSEQMAKEIEVMQRARMENPDLYYAVQDKWMSATQESYKKFFTQAQWKEYLAQGGEKIIREREKRQKKILEATEGKQSKSGKSEKKSEKNKK